MSSGSKFIRVNNFHVCAQMYSKSEVIDSNTLNFRPNINFSRLFFGEGTSVQVGVSASKAWSISSACKKLRAQHPLRSEILRAEKYPLGWVSLHLYNFFVCGPQFTRFLLSNVEGVVVVQLRVRFIFDVPTRSWDIRYQSRKLSQIAPKFGRFFGPPKF